MFESRELLEATARSGEPISRADIRGAIGDLRQAADQLKDAISMKRAAVGSSCA